MATCIELRGQIRSLLAELDEPTCIAVCVEGQELVYTARSGANPRDLAILANVSGALISEASHETNNILLPSPAEWKKQVPKAIHQARIYTTIGWEFESVGKDKKRGYCRPTSVPADLITGKINKSDWKHIGDAIGLAQWASTKIEGAKTC